MLRRVMMAGAAGPAWSPDAVFAVPGTVGFWLDPYDMGTLFQDAAGTVPVAADGDPVGLILDKSGNGTHVEWGLLICAHRPQAQVKPSATGPVSNPDTGRERFRLGCMSCFIRHRGDHPIRA